ncbi:MAG: DUF1573 domain-containing protein [Flavobacteriales bacterium]|nr:DUF1573 domain-containing protein [Flavobacteriales bacterium]
MKNAIIALAVFFAGAFSAQAQLNIESGAKIEFEKEVHDFGNLTQGGDATTEFKFTNTGNEPLIISNSQGSCGCTVPSWPREPIAPGASNVIKVKYDSQRLGPINKSVTITSNGINSPSTVIRIKGNITPPPANAAPVKEASPMAPKSN